MIIESAFTILPESIAGLGFQKVSREANAVGAFAFSLLNALHSKNVVDPIQRIQLEKPFSTQKAPLPAGASNRHCDVYVDYGGSKIGSSRLANFGWRYRNYVEAKFLKTYQVTATGRSTIASTYSAEIIADLIRLVVLVPEPDIIAGIQNSKTASARYLLVLADNPPSIFLNKFLNSLYTTFENPQKRAVISIDLTSGRSNNYLATRVGHDFGQIKLILNQCTCFSHYPLEPKLPNSMWMLMLRIDEATIELRQGNITHSYKIGVDRSLTESAPGDYSIIRNFVASNIK